MLTSVEILFVLRSSKMHCVNSQPQYVEITAMEAKDSKWGTDSKLYCPYCILKEYHEIRQSYLASNPSEQFFVFSDHSPVTPSNFRMVLKKAIELAGLDPNLYDTHSF